MLDALDATGHAGDTVVGFLSVNGMSVHVREGSTVYRHVRTPRQLGPLRFRTTSRVSEGPRALSVYLAPTDGDR